MVAMEAEAERLLIKEYVEKSLEAGEPVLQNARMKTKSSLMMSDDPSTLDTAAFFLAEYICNFGDVVKGGFRKRNFRITNNGSLPVIFEFPRNIRDFGLNLDPEHINKLAGFPKHDSQTFKISFQTSEETKLGPVEHHVPIYIKVDVSNICAQSRHE